MSSPAIFLETVDLRKDYLTGDEDLTILKGVNLSVERGIMHFIIGRSGSGKSTLMHLLGGLDRPTAGKILFEGEDLAEMNENHLAKIRNKRIGFVFQFYHLLPELTLYENVMLPAMIYGEPDRGWIREILRRVKLLSRKNHLPSQLSGGEQQRAAIARALVNHPSVVLCDEPTGNLDQETAESVFTLLEELNQKEGQSFVVVTHDETLAWRYRRIYRLQDGILTRLEQRHPGKTPLEKLP